MQSTVTNVATQMRERFLRLPDVEQQTGKKKSAIYHDMKLGLFPKPIRLGRRCVAWRESEVQVWMAERIAESQAND